MTSTRAALFLKKVPSEMKWVRDTNMMFRGMYILSASIVGAFYYCANKEERFDWYQLEPWVPARRRTTKKWPGGSVFYGWGNNALNRDCALLEWYCWRGYWGNEWGD